MGTEVRHIRERSLEEDSQGLNIGDPFILLNSSGPVPARASSELLFERGVGEVLGGRRTFRLVALDRAVDFRGTKKIVISTYWNAPDGSLSWENKAEEFPVKDPSLKGLRETEQLLPYHAFLAQHGRGLDYKG